MPLFIAPLLPTNSEYTDLLQRITFCFYEMLADTDASVDAGEYSARVIEWSGLGYAKDRRTL